MKVIVPFQVSDDMLVSSNLLDDDFSAWDQTVAYARGAQVVSALTHTVYRSLVADNINHNPDEETAAFADPLIEDPDTRRWQVMSATNRWRLFDARPTHKARNTGEIAVTISPGRHIGGLAFFGVVAEEITVRQISNGQEVYNRTFSMRDESRVVDWTSYFTEAFVHRSSLILTDLPVVFESELTITLTASAGNMVEVGQIVPGDLWEMGIARIEGSGFRGLDFSFVQTDEFGNLNTVVRDDARITDYSVWVDTRKLEALRHRVSGLRGGKPAVWIGSEFTGNAAVTYGFIRDFSLYYSTPELSGLALEIQEII